MGWKSLSVERRTAVSVLAVLLVADAAFILFHKLHNHGDGFHGWFQDARFDIGRDQGYSEILGYGKLALIVLALALVFQATRSFVYAAWSFAIVLVLLDDALTVHERGGDWLASLTERPSVLGVETAEVAQLVVWAAMAAVVVPVLLVAHRRSVGKARLDSLVFLGLFAVLVVLAVVVDLIDVVVSETALPEDTSSGYLAALEDGGEQAVLSAMTAYVIVIVGRTKAIPLFGRIRRGSSAHAVVRLRDGRLIAISRESFRRGFRLSPDGSKTTVCGGCMRTRTDGQWGTALSTQTRKALASADLIEGGLCPDCRKQRPTPVLS